jgi:DNA-binding MarR family transcriptional regulator
MTFQLSLSNLLTKAAREVTRRYQREVAPYGITASQAGLIFFLEKTGPTCQVRLAQILHLDKTNVNAMVRKLEQAGFLVQERDEDDARRSRIALTPKGKKLAVKLGDVDRKVGDEFNALAGSAQNETIIREYLEKIVFPSSDQGEE